MRGSYCSTLEMDVYEPGLSVGFAVLRQFGVLYGSFRWSDMRRLWLAPGAVVLSLRTYTPGGGLR